jgi:hypothetical protein
MPTGPGATRLDAGVDGFPGLTSRLIAFERTASKHGAACEGRRVQVQPASLRLD